jgi:2-polyprenyl-3-methyl-5-hydroxy-6-metoxy-1,4-benzoquinol methylase
VQDEQRQILEDYAGFIKWKDYKHEDTRLDDLYSVIYSNSNHALYMEWYQEKDRYEDFYRDNIMYLPELVRFNIETYSVTGRIVKFCLENNIKTVLDYGCGIGTHLIELAKNGIEVCGIEPNKKCTEFFWYRVDQNNLRNQVVLFADFRKYDLIICVDVLEHTENSMDILDYIKGNCKYAMINYSENFDIPMHTNKKDLKYYKDTIKGWKMLKQDIYEIR